MARPAGMSGNARALSSAPCRLAGGACVSSRAVTPASGATRAASLRGVVAVELGLLDLVQFVAAHGLNRGEEFVKFVE